MTGHPPQARQVPIADVVVAGRHRRNLGDLRGLAESMARIGQLHPIVLRSDMTLVAGQRRLEAAKMNGWGDIRAVIDPTFDDALAALQAERDENLCREPMTPSEMAEQGRAIEALEREKAAQRQRAAGGDRKSPTAKSVGEIFPNRFDNGRAADKVGEALGTSGRTYLKAKAVVEAAEQDPETFGPVRDEMDRTGKVNPAYQKVKDANSQPTEEGNGTRDPQSPNGPTDAPPVKPRGKGVDLAHEAINCLKRIPLNDQLRERGFQIVTDWIRHERRRRK